MKEGVEVKESPSDRKAVVLATIEEYKKQDPAKYELKKAALEAYVAKL